jgi:hypothetical protein
MECSNDMTSSIGGVGRSAGCKGATFPGEPDFFQTFLSSKSICVVVVMLLLPANPPP